MLKDVDGAAEAEKEEVAFESCRRCWISKLLVVAVLEPTEPRGRMSDKSEVLDSLTP